MTIEFESLKDLSEFLADFIPRSTAVWHAKRLDGRWVLEFTGGF